MTAPSMEEVRKCSIDTLKMIYYVIVGLAITEALQNVFLKQGRFLGAESFSSDNLPKCFLLLAFLPTICRFVHGASIHLAPPSGKRYKPLVDFFGFVIQASLFYLMASSLATPLLFSILFGAMLLCDTVWLIALGLIRYIEFDRTDKQWLRSNLYIILFLLEIYLLHAWMSSRTSAILILTVAVAATVWDYISNRDFYFPAS